MFIDSHCHLDRLDLSDYGGDLPVLLDKTRAIGVEHMLCVAIDMESYPALCALAQGRADVSLSVGVHPTERDGHDPSVDELAALAEEPQVVAIGETGLDYFRSGGDLEWQRERFRRHIAAARAARKPIIVHSRDAKEDTLRLLDEEGARDVGGVLHCFTGDWDMACRAQDLNFHISFSGIVTFKNAQSLQDIARRLPLERMLIETDAPYLAPVPHRGKSNQPAYVRHVAEFIADLRGVDTREIAAATTRNFYTLFKPPAASA